MSKNILVIEDDREIQNIITSYLQKEGFTVTSSKSGKKGFELFNNNRNFDLIILDIMLPDLDGWSVCRKVRQSSNIPIIMLTARDDEDDELYGFELKANDYIKKPFSPKILVARVNSILNLNNNLEKPEDKDIINKGKLTINPISREAFVEDELINLTNKEFNILLLLVKNENIVITREKILKNIWQYDYLSETRLIDNHIKNIRKALGDYSYYINTVFGVGYKFEVK